MKVRDELLVRNMGQITAVLTGNGKKEFRILRSIDEKYNGKDRLLFFPVLSQPFRGNGLQALKAVKTYLDIYGIENYLFIVDREAIEKDALTEIRRVLTSYGISILDIKRTCVKGEDALLVIGSEEKRGSRKTLHISFILSMIKKQTQMRQKKL